MEHQFNRLNTNTSRRERESVRLAPLCGNLLRVQDFPFHDFSGWDSIFKEHLDEVVRDPTGNNSIRSPHGVRLQPRDSIDPINISVPC